VLPVRDLDIVPEPSPTNLDLLHDTLVALTVAPWEVPASSRFPTLEIVSARTVYGEVDCLLERGRRDFQTLSTRASDVWVEDAPVRVASARDARALRAAYKGAPGG
jgi:hypothetical protein